MGARSNIVIIDPGYSRDPDTGMSRRDPEKDGRVWLYGHWMGPSSIHHARKGLLSGRAEGDPSYLARIIFSSMTANDDPDSETGYGISTRITDNEYPVIVIDSAPTPSISEMFKAKLEGDRSRTAVWLEDAEGNRVAGPVGRDEFLKISEDVDDFDELGRRMGAPEPTVPDDD